MGYLTLDEWGELNPELIGREFQPSELPVLKLNPIILTLYHKKYLTTCPLYDFLKSIQDFDFPNSLHTPISNDLKKRGVKSRAVGGGEVSDRLFDWISTESYIINDYIEAPRLSHEMYMGHTSTFIQEVSKGEMTLFWNDWWFSPGLFVVDSISSKYQFINWMAVMPLDGGK